VGNGVSLINFGAYGFGGTIAMYPEHIRRRLEGVDALAWGSVPNSAAACE
jgi:hypothetical protein